MKTLTTLLILTCLYSFGQVKVLKNKHLPGYSHKDTIFTDQEVWIQDYNEELDQRVEILDKQRRIDFLRGVLKKKEVSEGQLDSVLTLLINVKKESDSLSIVINSGLIEVGNEVIEEFKTLEARCYSLKRQRDDLVLEVNRLKKVKFWLWVSVISEGIAIVILI
jgi:hypothetical protein